MIKVFESFIYEGIRRHRVRQVQKIIGGQILRVLYNLDPLGSLDLPLQSPDCRARVLPFFLDSRFQDRTVVYQVSVGASLPVRLF